MDRPLASSIFAFILFSFCQFAHAKSVSRDGGVQRSVGAICRQSPVQVVVLVDITTENSTVFHTQQERLIATIDRIANLTSPVTFGLVAFHELPIVLQPLASPFSDAVKAIDIIENLRPRPRMDSSPAKALAVASKQVLKHGKAGARTVILMSHNGVSKDLLAETLEASAKLRQQDAMVMVIAGTAEEATDLPALQGYTDNKRGRLYITDGDRQRFFAELDEVIGACVVIDGDANFANMLAEKNTKNVSRGSFDIKARATGDGERRPLRFMKDTCDFNKVDLMIVLDTSASVFTAFKEERAFAADLIKALHPDAFIKGLQVGAVRFAAGATVAIPFQIGRTKGEILERILGIQFTGSHTRIANAIDVALTELNRARRPDAKQVFILITDGHGQEFWSQVQASGLKLQMANAEIFSATISRDFNLGELILYTGDESHVFVGPRQTTFIPTVTQFINKCLQNPSKSSIEDTPKKDAMAVVDLSTDQIISDSEKVTKSDENKSGSSTGTTAQPSRFQIFAQKRNNGSSSATTTTATLKSGEMRGISFSKEPKVNCTTDFLLILDRNTAVEDDFTKQLNLAMELVDRVKDDELASQTVRFGVITFAQNAKVEISLGKLKSRKEILRQLKDVAYAKGPSSAIVGFKKAIEELSSKRRSEANLIVVLISDGTTQDEWGKVQETASALHELKGTVYAATVSRSYQFAELEAFAGDKWRVFTEARQRHFTEKIADQLDDCKKTPSHEARAIGSSQCEQDLIDFVILLDLSAGDGDAFDREKQFAIDLIKKIPSYDFINRTRVALITFSELGKLELSLKTNTSQDDILYVLGRVDQSLGGQKSIVAGVGRALQEVTANRRPLARLVMLIISDGFSQNKPEEIELSAVRLHAAAADVYVVTGSKKVLLNELKEYAGSEAHVFAEGKEKRFLTELTTVFECSYDGSPDSLTTTGFLKPTKATRNLSDSKSSAESKKPKDSPLIGSANAIETETKKEVKPEKTLINRPDNLELVDQKKQPDNGTSNNSDENPNSIPKASSEKCKVDLIFIIDRSQSVEKDFQQQLMFAVNLVRRLDSKDFEQRVRVAAVSFNTAARIDFPFGQHTNREEVMESLLMIDHTGGSTSTVSGVNLAVEEINRGRRSDARVMAVLISDGNSQDHWEQVLAASNRLRAANVDVRAVTVSHDYFFRELELYAGNKWFVYIDARIRLFLDEAEHSIVHCQGPTIPSSNDIVLQQRAVPTTSTTITTSTSTIPSTTTTSTTTTTTTPPTTTSTTTTTPSTTSATTATSPTTTSTTTTTTTMTTTTTSSTTTPATTTTNPARSPTFPLVTDCDKDIVDLVFMLDTSTSVENEFYAEKLFAVDLVKILPEIEFSKRISVALITFAGEATLRFGLAALPERNDVLYELERVEHSGGQTSLAAAAKMALETVLPRRRPDSRLVFIVISDGNSQDQWHTVQHMAKRLRDTGGEIYAVTLSENYFLDELKEYTGNPDHVYIGARIMRFVQDVGTSVITCPGRPSINLTPPPLVEVTVTPSPHGPHFTTTEPLTKTSLKPVVSTEFIRDEQPINAVAKSSENPNGLHRDNGKTTCAFSKMDLVMILDASTSREEVFEHQRELALSLIERLPIAADMTHVAVGINSFTSVPVLRQTLGLGRDKLMVRKAIENIPYHGGSTLTSEAVKLTVQDLKHGRRSDAKQVVVLMNDGMSQDSWEAVLEASAQLAETGAERFGVALGSQIDYRELKHYIGNDSRIYRDGSTEKFLSDVVKLLTDDKSCAHSLLRDEDSKPTVSRPGVPRGCGKPKMDIVVMFDMSDMTPNLTDPAVNANRYLLLDVLGSIPLDGTNIRVAVVSFAGTPQLSLSFDDPQTRDEIFKKIEAIEAIPSRASYAKAVDLVLSEYNKRRLDADGLLLIVGDGNSLDSPEARKTASQRLRSLTDLTSLAVDSAKFINTADLTEYTGDPANVYSYDRNAEFAQRVMKQATVAACRRFNRLMKPISILPPADHRIRDISDPTVKMGDIEGDEVIKKFVIPSKNRLSIATRMQPVEQNQTTTTVAPTATIEEEKPETSTTVIHSGGIKRPRKPALKADGTARVSIQKIALEQPNDDTAITDRTTVRSGTATVPPKPVNQPVKLDKSACRLDVLLIVDVSRSAEPAFKRVKNAIAAVIDRLRMGEQDTRVALIKFSSTSNARVVYSFGSEQSKAHLMSSLNSLRISSGSNAIVSALEQALEEYSPARGARPGRATPLAILFSDGFSIKKNRKAAANLRKAIPTFFAVTMSTKRPINFGELTEIVGGDRDRVYSESTLESFYKTIERLAKNC